MDFLDGSDSSQPLQVGTKGLTPPFPGHLKHLLPKLPDVQKKEMFDPYEEAIAGGTPSSRQIARLMESRGALVSPIALQRVVHKNACECGICWHRMQWQTGMRSTDSEYLSSETKQ